MPFVYEASFPLRAGKAGGSAGADAPPEDLRNYRPDFYLPDDPEAPVTAEGGVWLEHYAHDRSGRAPAEFAGYEKARAWKRRLHESLSTRYIETSFGDLQRAWDGDVCIHTNSGRLASVRVFSRRARMPVPGPAASSATCRSQGSRSSTTICVSGRASGAILSPALWLVTLW